MSRIFSGLSKVFVYILISLVAISFVAWGIGDVIKGRGVTDVATVGNIKIPVEQFNKSVQTEIANIQKQNPSEVIAPELKKSIEDAVVENMINRAVLQNETSNLGIVVPKEILANFIKANFSNKNGEFDKNAFRTYLNNLGMSEKHYLEMLKSSISGSTLVGAIGSSQLISETLLNNYLQALSRKRVVDIVEVTPAEASKTVEEAEIEKFYKQNSNLFMAEEARDVSYILINPNNVPKEPITEDKIKAEYEAEKAAHTPVETREVKQAVFGTEEAANQALAEIQGGKDIKSYETYSTLESITKDEVLGDIRSAIFSLNEKEVSQPVSSDLGWHIFIVDKISASKFPEYPALKESIRKNLGEKLESESVTTYLNKIEDDLASGQSLEEVAAKNKFEFKKVSRLTRKFDSKSKALESSKEFINIAFNTDQGFDSGIKLIRPGHPFVVIRADKVMSEKVKDLAEVKDAVAQKVIARKQDEDTVKKSYVIADKLKSGAKPEGVKITENISISRNAESSYPAEVINAGFSIGLGEVSPLFKAKGKYYMVKFKKHEEITAKFSEPEKAKLMNEIRSGYLNDIIENYFNVIRDKYSVSVAKRAPVEQ